MSLSEKNLEILRSSNLNLLLTLFMLLEYANVSRAAQVMGMSQAAMSQALNRLRVQFEDPLLIKSYNGMTLSSKAEAIMSELQNCLTMASALLGDQNFDPTKVQDEIRFAMNDVAAQLLIPNLIKHFAKLSPGLKLEYQSQHKECFQLLLRDRLDLVAGFYETFPKGVQHTSIGKACWQYVTLDNKSGPKRLISYQFQEYGQLKQLQTLQAMGKANQGFLLKSESLSVLVNGLRQAGTATFLPRHAVLVLPEVIRQRLVWFGEPQYLDLHLCWVDRPRQRELHQYFRNELTSLIKSSLLSREL
ncbi:LysR family transcriptional regulator [Shewanella khirikhana]|uniref:HTH-type transcriptional regulator LeuO n=1 Tax=Shewanella khirikhana TaxID=1965282 RepID=A0ABM7DPD8_9GAMM|nr:LysR family transcriptional regulator [Shewanella khirikhana]AZQ11534.1 HTH-type transcriptional regulator LeuO [Shewanella khirikhana]